MPIIVVLLLQIRINRDNDISNDDNRESIKRDVHQIPDEVTHLKDLLRDTFIKNYKETLEKDLPDRLINTRLNKKIDKNIIIAANDIAKEILETIENPGFWELNCHIYATAMTCEGYNNDIQTIEPEKAKEKLDMPKWIYQLEESISRVRREINQITVLIKCETEKQLTAHQKRLLNNFFKKSYGNIRMATLKFKCRMLKEDLKSKTEKLRYQKKIIERKKTKKLFCKDPKKVYRAMKGSTITPKNIPSKQNVETFWKGIWNNPSECNVTGVDWMKELKSNYCLNATKKPHEIDKMTIDKAINQLKPNKALGRDMITGYWYKQLNFYRSDLTRLYHSMLVNDQVLPTWISTAKTILLPKNTDTHIAKNYRPIALLNITYKIYTSCINMFLTDHVIHNNIITNEQAGGKKGTWGTTEQLIINKSTLKEAKNSRRNLVTVWLDYRKAFDSIPHSWLLQALKLAKVPGIIINAIKNLTKTWYSILTLSSETETLSTQLIKFLQGIFQGDSLSVMLFVLCLNPLSLLLDKAIHSEELESCSIPITFSWMT